MAQPRPMPPALGVLCAGMLFASGGALLKSCELPSLQRAGLRALFAAITLFALLPRARRPLDRRILLLLPAYFGATCLFVVANALTTAANAIFLQSTAPLWLVVLGPWLLGERNTRRDWLVLGGVGVGMTVCLLAPTEAARTAPDPRLGDAIALISGIAYSFLLLGLRWLSRAEPGANLAAIAWGNALTCPLAFACMPIVGQSAITGTGTDWLVVAVLGVFQVGLAYALLARSIHGVPAARASLLLMVEVALNPLIVFAVHDERPHLLTLCGGALIVGTVLAGSLLRRSAR